MEPESEPVNNVFIILIACLLAGIGILFVFTFKVIQFIVLKLFVLVKLKNKKHALEF